MTNLLNGNLLKHDQLELKCYKLLELGIELVALIFAFTKLMILFRISRCKFRAKCIIFMNNIYYFHRHLCQYHQEYVSFTSFSSNAGVITIAESNFDQSVL